MTNKYHAFKSREECERYLKQQAAKQYIDYLIHSGMIEYDDYLMHSGRLGMKWGQHIFAKVKSGAKKVARGVSKTRKRAKSIVRKLKAKRLLQKAASERKKTAKAEKKASKKGKDQKKKSVKDMTDEELDSATRRLQKENSYNQELAKQNPIKKQSFGSKLADAAKEGLAAGVKGLITSGTQDIGKKIIKDMLTDPEAAKLKIAEAKKKTKEAELWVEEATRTKTIPTWDTRYEQMLKNRLANDIQGGKKKQEKKKQDKKKAA